MLDLLMNQTVTLRRAKPGGLSLEGKIELAYVVDVDETQLELRCRIEGRGRRILDPRGVEIKSDAQMSYRVTGKPALKLEDVVVTKDGLAWRVVGLEEQEQMFGGAKYGRADLMRTEIPVVKDKHFYG